MSAPEGFILLHKRILDWEWYDDANTMRLFVHCMLSANYQENTWRGITIKRGEFISSIEKLSQKLKLSPKQIRTAISKLKRTNELETVGKSQHTVFIIKNYDDYQPNGKPKGKQRANEGQTEGKQRATTNELNNNNKNNNPNGDVENSFCESQENNEKVQKLSFDDLVKAYPKQEQIFEAEAEFNRLDPSQIQIGVMLISIDEHKNSLKWQNSQYIPSLANWLIKKRWRDKPEQIDLSSQTGDLSDQPDEPAKQEWEKNFDSKEDHDEWLRLQNYLGYLEAIQKSSPRSAQQALIDDTKAKMRSLKKTILSIVQQA